MLRTSLQRMRALLRVASRSPNRTAPSRRFVGLALERMEARVAPASLTSASGALVYAASSGVNNNVSVSISGGDFVLVDSAETITTTLSGENGSGSHSVSIPVGTFTGLTLNLGDGDDTIAAGGLVLAGQAIVVNQTGKSLTLAGPVTTAGTISISAQNALNVNSAVNAGSSTITMSADTGGVGSSGFVEDPSAGSISTTNASSAAITINVNTASGGTGNASIRAISAPNGTLTINANGGSVLYSGADTLDGYQQGTLLAGGVAPTGTVVAQTISLVASGGGSIGTAARPIETDVPTGNLVSLASGDGGAYLVDWGSALTLGTTSATGTGNIRVVTGSGVAHDLHIAGSVSTVTGNIELASDDNLILGANVNAGSGTITLVANADGDGSEGFDQQTATLTTTNASTSALSITVNTPAGGAGNAILGLGTIGSASGGTVTVNAGAGNILWSNLVVPIPASFSAALTGLANGGSNANTLQALNYDLSATGLGGIGTNARPLQFDNFGPTGAVSPPTLVASSGSGGVYITIWDQAASDDPTIGNVSSTGAGNIRIVAAHANNHSLWVNGTVTTGSGTITLSSDDDIHLLANSLVGGPGFSGTVAFNANRDQTNGEGIYMDPTSAIVTSDDSPEAVDLDVTPFPTGVGYDQTNLGNGGVFLSNITVGDGGAITVDAGPPLATPAEGTIIQHPGTLLNAGPDGTVVLGAQASDTTMTPITMSGQTLMTSNYLEGGIGVGGLLTSPEFLPIDVSAGIVVASTTGVATLNSGDMCINDAIAGTFVATTTANGTVQLSTSSGALTIGSGGVNTGGGAIEIESAGVAVVSGPLNAGAGPVLVIGNAEIAGTTYAPSSPTTITGNVEVASGATFQPAANTSVNGTLLADPGSVFQPFGTGTGQFPLDGLQSSGTLALDLDGTTAGTNYDQLDVDAAPVSLSGTTLSLNTSSSLTVGNTFTLISNSSGNPALGQFVGGTLVNSANNPNQLFTINYAGGTGNDVVATLSSIMTGNFLSIDAGQLLYVGGAGLSNNVTVSLTGGVYTVTDPSGPITLTPQATAAGWSGSGTTAVSGLASTVSSLSLETGDGTDSVVLSNLANPFSVSEGGLAGDTVTIGGVLSFAGNASITGAGSIVCTPGSEIESPSGTLSLAASGAIGSSSSPLSTLVAAATIAAGGNVFLSEADGLSLSAALSAGNLNVVNGSGTLTMAGPTSTAGGSITLSSGDGVVVAANLSSGGGTIAMNANTDGAGTDGFSQTAGTITTASTSSTALVINVNTAAGGTGNATLDSVAVGSSSGGSLVVNAHGGSILYGGVTGLSPFQVGTTGVEGTAPINVLEARNYVLTTSGAGSIGTDARPLQSTNFGADSLGSSDFTLNAGSGGVYLTDWGNIDVTLSAVSVIGAGNIRVTTASGVGHNLDVAGNIVAASGNIFLAADDNLSVTGSSVIGGPGFSGTVWMQANRDLATAGETFTFSSTSSIQTTNTDNVAGVADASRTPTTQAVYLDISGDPGTPSALTLSSIKVGDSGRIVASADPNGISKEAGAITMAGSADVLDAGTTGTIDLSVGLTAITPADALGTAALPIVVAGGNILVADNYGNMYLSGNAATSFAVSISGSLTGQSGNAVINLSTAAGPLTVAAATTDPTGGSINLAGAGGVILAAPVGSPLTTGIHIAGPLSGSGNLIEGTAPITLFQSSPSTYSGSISGTQSVTKFGSGSLTLTGTSTYTGPTSISAGSLIVNGSIASSTASLALGAVLGGDGTIGGVINSGAVAPGAVATPSTLSVRNLTLGPGSLVLDLSSAASDSVSTTGSSVSISGAVLSLNVGAITPGESFTILTAPANTVQGTFADLPSSGSSFVVGAVTFTINYAAGPSGDDILLTASDTFSTLVSTVLNGGLSYIDSTIAAKQHSMVENVVYSFSSAVSLTTSNFALTGMSGTTTAPSVALASSNGGTVWTVTFTGTGVNNATQSIGDGEYALALSGVPGLANSTFDFFRLLGDMDGNGTVDSSDFNILISSFLRGTADPAYLGADDLDGNGKVDGSDFNIFVSNFLKKLPDTTLLN
jgi:trimeric autotransporter adhesin